MAICLARVRLRLALSLETPALRRYSPSGTEVAVILDQTEEFGRVVINDQGVGIPLAEQIRLFTRFMRVDRPDSEHVPGTGMGLYLSRELARRMGGDIVLQWAGPGGSSFALLMPRAKD